MNPKLPFLLVAVVLYPMLTIGQDSTSIPKPQALRQSITLDLVGNTPLIGFSYHNELIRFHKVNNIYKGGVELSAGLGYVPGFCLLERCTGSLSTHHSLLFLYGSKLRAEVGYGGSYLKIRYKSGGQENAAYVGSPVLGARYSTKSHWLIRAYLVTWFNTSTYGITTESGDRAVQKVKGLFFFPGVCFGKQF